ncbi:MAG TPA: hypothetical protein ENG63_06460 [Candidatus Desulfofervidus auxilii]|uniref:Nudix hydrolase domain-containing protein n=1 Tax=Desulfofervidus auxilii TaxID=1621989 RepID=A0A7C0U322_DESA2|nr:hypothetical protein [Candidatus Desulfofervidus auxilii]
MYPLFWECGGGQVHIRESFEEAVRRQMWEEFGIKVKVLKSFTSYVIPSSNGRPAIPGVRFLVCYH